MDFNKWVLLGALEKEYNIESNTLLNQYIHKHKFNKVYIYID